MQLKSIRCLTRRASFLRFAFVSTNRSNDHWRIDVCICKRSPYTQWACTFVCTRLDNVRQFVHNDWYGKFTPHSATDRQFTAIDTPQINALSWRSFSSIELKRMEPGQPVFNKHRSNGTHQFYQIKIDCAAIRHHHLLDNLLIRATDSFCQLKRWWMHGKQLYA